MENTSPHRRFKLRIWWLALGYFIFYAPYSFLIKVLTSKLWPGVTETVSGFRLLPAVAISTAIVLPAFITLKGWWKYTGHRRCLGLSVPWPGLLVFLSGFGTALIIGTTTLVFTFTGVSILFALLLMRGGVLLIAPGVDLLFRRRVRWFSWAALAFAFPALFLALTDVNNYRLTVLAALTIAAYLSGYLFRLPCVTKLAKIDDKAVTRGYFVAEAMVAVFFLVTVPAVFALIGKGAIMMELRDGFIDFLASGVTLPAILIGALYAGLYCFGTLIYLDCRENTFCIPLNRGSSLLAGVVATYMLALVFEQKLPSEAQLGSAGMIVIALLFLSPLHHFQRTLGKFAGSLASLYRMLPRLITAFENPRLVTLSGRQTMASEKSALPLTESADQEGGDKVRRLFLFVCSGNTCRSPMAAAIANAEIAARLQLPFEALETVNARALSAGVSAKVGAPLASEAQEVLRSLDVPVRPHAARNLTAELAHEAEMIFCMTSAHRKAVIDMIPSVAWKTYCLDPQGDLEDPIGMGLAVYLDCARRIQGLVRMRFDELSLRGQLSVFKHLLSFRR
jgi:protein-tyrosine-phosphatase